MAVHLITGANRGLGYQFTRQLLENGHDIHAVCRRPAEASELSDLVKASQDGPGSLRVHAGDVSSEESLRLVAEKLSALDVLINNAGIIGERDVSLEHASLENIAHVMDVNVYGLIRSVRAFLPALRKGSGKKIVNISSLMGSIADNGSGRYTGYRLSKAGVNVMTRNLEHELKDQDFTVIALHPGWVQTDMGGPAAPLEPRDSVAAMIATFQKKTLKDSGKFFDRFGEPLPF